MTLTINGTPTQAPDGLTVAQLLTNRGLLGRPCAVEVNAKLVPKDQHADHALADGDTLEIVTLVGGG